MKRFGDLSYFDKRSTLTQTMKYDVIVIETGQSGPRLAGQLATAGMQMGVIEGNWLGEHVSTSAASRPRPWWQCTCCPHGQA